MAVEISARDCTRVGLFAVFAHFTFYSGHFTCKSNEKEVVLALCHALAMHHSDSVLPHCTPLIRHLLRRVQIPDLYLPSFPLFQTSFRLNFTYIVPMLHTIQRQRGSATDNKRSSSLAFRRVFKFF